MAAPSPDARGRRPNYYAARTALAKHMHRHHQGAYGTGTLAERIEQHDDLHWHCTQRDIPLRHQHAELGDDETMIDVAHRYFREGSNG
jgi:hypothetical protein